MDIVVDTSALIAVIAGEPIKGRLIEMTSGAVLIAPQSVHWEIGNALSAMLKRRRITRSQALQAIEVYRKIPLRFVEVELEHTLKMVDQLSIYAYDAYLIRCALKYKAPLLTLDHGLAEAADKLHVKLLVVES